VRQENFFKYARGHLGLDVLTTYAAETAVTMSYRTQSSRQPRLS
jgi:hypothetical protein